MLIHTDGTTQELGEICRSVRNSASGSGGLWIDYDGNTLSVSHDAYNANSKPDPIVNVTVDLSAFFKLIGNVVLWLHRCNWWSNR